MKSRKSDQELQQDIVEELKWDPMLKHTVIGTAVYRGIVTLSGYVRSYLEKNMAEAAVRRVAGVRAVVEDLHVQLPPAHVRSDAAIATAIVSAFRLNPELPVPRIRVVVEDGHVTLDGNVDWHYQKDMATETVRCIAGVKGISNFLFIRPTLQEPVAVASINRALKRQADLQDADIRVTIVGNRAILTGQVGTWLQWHLAERLTWAAPGITAVKNELEVLA